MSPAEILKAAKEKLSDPARRYTGELARTADGRPVYVEAMFDTAIEFAEDD